MTTAPTYGDDVAAEEAATGALAMAARAWWLWLVVGIAWCFAALIILQFDKGSVTTVGVIVGIMFLGAGIQQFVLASMVDSLRWLWYIFGGLFIVAGILAIIRPVNTFAGLADMLGFLFLLFGIWWTVEPFWLKKTGNPAWWLGFITGPIMILTAFWTSGQFFIHKAYILLVFAGIWALCHGITDIFRAVAVRSLLDQLS